MAGVATSGLGLLFFSHSFTFIFFGFLSIGDTLELVGGTALVTRVRFRDAAGAVKGEEELAGEGDGREVLGTLMECADVSSLCFDLQCRLTAPA